MRWRRLTPISHGKRSKNRFENFFENFLKFFFEKIFFDKKIFCLPIGISKICLYRRFRIIQQIFVVFGKSFYDKYNSSYDRKTIGG